LERSPPLSSPRPTSSGSQPPLHHVRMDPSSTCEMLPGPRTAITRPGQVHALWIPLPWRSCLYPAKWSVRLLSASILDHFFLRHRQGPRLLSPAGVYRSLRRGSGHNPTRPRQSSSNSSLRACAHSPCRMLVNTAAVAWAAAHLATGFTGVELADDKHSDMADEIGWPEFVAQVAAIRDTLSPEDRTRLAILANNYGEAGALSLYGPQFNLPTPSAAPTTFTTGATAHSNGNRYRSWRRTQRPGTQLRDCTVAAEVRILTACVTKNPSITRRS